MRHAFAVFAALALATPAGAQISNPPPGATAPDLSGYALRSEVQQVDSKATDAATAAQAAQTAASGAVRTVNGITPTNGAVTVPVPTASTTTPPGVTEVGTAGTMTSVYALANHTHASKVRRERILVPVTNGAVVADVTFKNASGVATPFNNLPVCAVTAETTLNDTNVVNAQIDGTPTVNGMRVRVTRTAIAVASLLGLNILSVPTQVATWTHYICIEP